MAAMNPRPYTPAPRPAGDAARIRERYLRQLGLQRGGGAPARAAAHAAPLVVVSGLPSLPEDQQSLQDLSAGPGLEAHDFSGDPSRDGAAPRAADAAGDDPGAPPAPALALAYPAALRRLPVPPPAADPRPRCPPSDRHAFPPSLWSKSGPALADYGGDHDSVSSAGTCTTAESSLTAGQCMVARDWGAAPRPASAAQGVGESPTTPMGVYFQSGHPRLFCGAPPAAAPAPCPAASSLAHALHGFNIDSDCDASVASNYEDADGLSLDDAASLGSHASVASARSAGGRRRAARPKKRGGKAQRLLDRAAAHERILRRGASQSQRMRAELVRSQRLGGEAPAALPAPALGLASAVPAAESRPGVEDKPRPSGNARGPTGPGQVSVVLHVQHGPDGCSSTLGIRQGVAGREEEASLPHLSTMDFGRTPTASNCTDLRRLKEELHDQLIGEASVPDRCLPALPSGVHVSSVKVAAPLGLRPQLAMCVPAPPPKLAAARTLPPSSSFNTGHASRVAEVEDAKAREAEESTCSLHHLNHQATVDDVMEVAMTLSKLGDRSPGPVPRIR